MSSVFSSGQGAARRAQRRQEEAIAKQKQIEGQQLAEKDDEIARRKALAKSGSGGRRSLIKTSEAGVSGSRESLG